MAAARQDPVRVRSGANHATEDNERVRLLDELLAPESMREIREELQGAMTSNAPIMFLGESGVGKTRLATAFARATHQEPIVRATLGMADDLNTITSELFGHERGAFSGAVSKRKGLVDYANGGTLLLDEVLNLPRHAQKLLLDFAQFGSYRPLGYQGCEPKTADLRLLSPGLPWPGNIRQLEAVLERGRSRARTSGSGAPVIEAGHLDPCDPLAGASARAPERPVTSRNDVQVRWQQLCEQRACLDVLEKEIIEQALAACGGVVARAARELSMSRTGLISRMATLEIDPDRFRRVCS